MGSNFAARYEGISPEITPTIKLINIAAMAKPIGRVEGKNILITKLNK